MATTFRGYTTQQARWTLSDRTFDLTWPADMDALLDAPETLERFERDEYMPYWAEPWPASILLADAVLHEGDGNGREAIELGCGIGLVSLAAAMRGWTIKATDYDADAVAFAALNAENNNLTQIETGVVDFREPLETPRYDAVFGADLTYERRNAEPLVGWIASALKPGGYALLSDPNRAIADDFPAVVAKVDLTIEACSVEIAHPQGHQMQGHPIQGRLWRLTR